MHQSLSEHLIILIFILEGSSCSENPYICPDTGTLLDRLFSSLCIQVPPRRPKRDEIETTSLFRALLELSGGKTDLRQHVFLPESTVHRNAELIASLLGVTTTKEFGSIEMQDTIEMISHSPVFSKTTINVQELCKRVVNTKRSLRLGFEEGHLVRHLQECYQVNSNLVRISRHR